MSRFSKVFRTFFIEEPVQTHNTTEDYLQVTEGPNAPIFIVTPHVSGTMSTSIDERMASLLRGFLASFNIDNYINWYYSPLFLRYTEDLHPLLTIYDCMDELAAFKGADASLPILEHELLKKADVVFTGGHSLYQAKKNRHPRVYEFASSIDKDHFLRARDPHRLPHDQASIDHPKFGFFGVLDERLDLELLRQVATLRPDWNFILIGPVVKIDANTLPRADNIHYLGSKSYQELPAYLSDWDIAFIPFALNESTRYISPTKTPEFLCGGKRVIATAIEDIVTPYGKEGLVSIAHNATQFVELGAALLEQRDATWLACVDEFLKDKSWDDVFQNMYKLIQDELHKALAVKQNKTQYV